MQERTTDARPASDHGITIEQTQLPAGRPFRASCLCGWRSEIVPSRPAAVAAGQEHTEGNSITEADLFDPQLEYSIRDVDPLIDPCPSWCRFTPHKIQSHDSDRTHFGPEYRIVLRDVRAEYYNPSKGSTAVATYTLGHVMMYLRQGTRNRAPMIEANLNDTGVGIKVTLDEAELITRALLEMMEAAR
jgi:hypothetical protein